MCFASENIVNNNNNNNVWFLEQRKRKYWCQFNNGRKIKCWQDKIGSHLVILLRNIFIKTKKPGENVYFKVIMAPE